MSQQHVPSTAACVGLVTVMRGRDGGEDDGHILKYTAGKQGSPAAQTRGAAAVDVLVALTRGRAVRTQGKTPGLLSKPTARS